MSDFTFLLVTDTHVDARESAMGYNCWNSVLTPQGQELLSHFVDEANAIKPDFVIHCGDVTDASDEHSYRAAFNILSKLNCPLYFVPGNHDTWEPNARRLAATLLGMQEPDFFQVIHVSGWRLILIDAVYWINKDNTVHDTYDEIESVDIITPDHELSELKTELERDSITPTLCFAHPVLKTRSGWYPVMATAAEKGTDDDLLMNPADYLANSERITNIINNYQCVKAAFCGHGHWNECLFENVETGQVKGRILYCQTASLAEYPCEYRIISVTSKRINVEVLSLAQGKFAEQSYVSHRCSRWPAGRPEDRLVSHTFHNGLVTTCLDQQ